MGHRQRCAEQCATTSAVGRQAEDGSIDVIVVNYRTPALTFRAVRAVSGPLTSVYVTDNSGDLPTAFDDVSDVWRPGYNTHFARGNNYWYDRSDRPWVLLLNPDVELDYPSLLRLRGELAARPECWGVAPRLINSDGSDQNYLQRMPTAMALIAQLVPPLRPLARKSISRHLCAEVDLRQTQAVEQPPAACLLLRRSSVGPTLFHEDLSLFFNDTYLAWRLNRSGHCLYAANISALHERGASIRTATRMQILRRYADGMRRYAALTRMPGWRLVWLVATARMIISRVSFLGRHPS